MEKRNRETKIENKKIPEPENCDNVWLPQARGKGEDTGFEEMNDTCPFFVWTWCFKLILSV